MKLIIAKVDEVLFDGQAYSVTLPAAGGEMTVLHGHMPLVTTLKEGSVVVHATAGSPPQRFAIEGGVLEVTPDSATIIL